MLGLKYRYPTIRYHSYSAAIWLDYSDNNSQI